MSEEKTKGHCRVCDGEYTLTKNGRIRSHGGCGGGSDLPREAVEQPVPKTASGGPNPHRAPLAPDASMGATGCKAHGEPACDECLHYPPMTPSQSTAHVLRDLGCAVCQHGGHHCFDCEKKVPHGSLEICRDCQIKGGTYDPNCQQCDTDDHRCPGCGAPTDHATIVCADCEVFYAGEDLRPTAADVRAAEEFMLTAPADVPDGVEGEADNILAMATTYGVRPEKPGPQPTPSDDHWAARAKQLVREGASPFDAAAILDHEMEMARALSEESDASDFFTSDAPSDEDLAADFFAGEEPEQAPSKGRWFPSRFDGECDTCFAHFERGEEIRADGEGGWQGRECCGDAEDDGEERPQAPRPRRVSPKPPMRAGRYKLPLPSTGKPTAFSRVTTFVKLASDHFGLKQWEMRSALVGLSRQPDILDQVAGLDVKKDRDRLNALAEMAKDAAGAKDRASTGTKLHKWTEEVDSVRLTLDQVPDEFRTDVRRYREALEASGYRVVPHLIERTTVVEELGVVGTFDQLWQAPDGRYVVVDKKTGELTYGQMEIAAQLAIYAHGVNRHGVAEWDEALGDAADEKAWVWRRPRDEDGSAITVDESVGIVVHMPQDGRGITLYEVDLATGWAHAQLCGQVRAHQKVKSTMAPIPLPDRDLTPAPTAAADLLARIVPAQPEADSGPSAPATEEVPRRSLTWAERFAAVVSPAEAYELLKQARDAGMPKARQDELVLVARAALAA